MANATRETIRFLIRCPDHTGIIAAVARFLADHNGNILDTDQHTDAEHGDFFMRVEIDADGFALSRETIAASWEPFAESLNMDSTIRWSSDVKRAAILVSRESHCLQDLLWRWRAGELPIEVPLVISNHDDCRALSEHFGVTFRHMPVSRETKSEQEVRVLDLLRSERIDFVVLARYMQILSPQFLDAYPNQIINVHHSFLPAFVGPRPYHQAYERGVKIIGATSHYVTADLDQGPIIAQATLPVDHRDGVTDLVRKGRDLERVVLAEAVHHHAADKILTSRNRTVLFS